MNAIPDMTTIAVEAFLEMARAFHDANKQITELFEAMRPYIKIDAKKERARKRYQRMMERRTLTHHPHRQRSQNDH